MNKAKYLLRQKVWVLKANQQGLLSGEIKAITISLRTATQYGVRLEDCRWDNSYLEHELFPTEEEAYTTYKETFKARKLAMIEDYKHQLKLAKERVIHLKQTLKQISKNESYE